MKHSISFFFVKRVCLEPIWFEWFWRNCHRGANFLLFFGTATTPPARIVIVLNEKVQNSLNIQQPPATKWILIRPSAFFFRKRETSGQPKPRDVGIRWWRFRGWSRPPKTEPTPFEPSSSSSPSSECVFQAPFCPLLGHGSPSRWCCCSRSHSCTWPPDRTRGPNSDSPFTNLPIVPTTSFFLSFTSSNQKNHNTILAGHGQPPPPPPPPSSSYACLPRRFFTRKNRTQSTVNGGGS